MIKRLAMILLLAALVSGCGGPVNAQPPIPTMPEASATLAPSPTSSPTSLPPTDTPAPTETPLPTATPVPQNVGPDNYPNNIDPLTGLQAPEEMLNRRPLSVKIELFPRMNRPPWGISLADIVYDYYQNNGMTRLHTIFLGKDAEKVGPIRSARLFDGNLIRMYKSVIAFGGADKRVLDKLFNSEFWDRLIVEGERNCPPMCREDPNGANLLTTNTKELSKYATTKNIQNVRQNLNGMSFAYQPPAGGVDGTQVFVRFSIAAYVRWDYDPASGRYLRFQDTQEDESGQGEAYVAFQDRLTGTQVAADNVVVIQVPHNYVYRSATGESEIVDMSLDKTGPAYLFRDGKVYEALWSRTKFDSVLTLVDKNGQPFPFKNGNTWFEVIGKSSQIEDKGSGIWRFVFSIP